ncbi:MAG: hypothetical protein NC936_01910 [Candidatus Omnitrophica bacterium]|nr:hypothetical protein [Candidatus Omnitrophota bacterium]
MEKTLIQQFFALSLFALLIGICFCDGFKLHVARKLVWFAIFLAISIYVFLETAEFNLALILPIPTILAIILGKYELWKAKNLNKNLTK